MKPSHTKAPRHSDDIAARAKTMDLTKYADHLAELHLTQEQEQELLAILNTILIQFVDLCFGVHQSVEPCGKASANANPPPIQASDMLYSSLQSKDLNNAAADETPVNQVAEKESL
ncbi:MAG: hypothetical protein AAF608_11730 [Pseudomonadota bacterium]